MKYIYTSSQAYTDIISLGSTIPYLHIPFLISLIYTLYYTYYIQYIRVILYYILQPVYSPSLLLYTLYYTHILYILYSSCNILSLYNSTHFPSPPIPDTLLYNIYIHTPKNLQPVLPPTFQPVTNKKIGCV